MSSGAPDWMNAAVFHYIESHTAQPDEVLRDLAIETESTGVAMMQIGAGQGALMQLLVRLTGAVDAIEIGTFTGYSALCVARALPENGRLMCCDINRDFASMGERYWERAGVRHKIDLRIAPALETLAGLPLDQAFDFAFIDADKPNYRNYFDALLPRIRTNGLLLVDNTLWSGEVTKTNVEPGQINTLALQAFNDFVAADNRVESFLLPIGDGVTLIRKK